MDHADGSGSGAVCTCPNGESYAIGDFGTSCGSLACIGGITSDCETLVTEGANKMVICERKNYIFETLRLEFFDIVNNEIYHVGIKLFRFSCDPSEALPNKTN